MNKSDSLYSIYVQILKEELVMAMGCTEPIAISYACAKATQVLDHLPDRIVVKASGSIIKNVKSVIVPHTNGLKGIEVAAAAGALYGDADAKLEVLSNATRDQIEELPEYVQNTNITVQHIEQGHVFDLEINVYYEQEHASVRIVDTHTNIVQIEKDWKVVFEDKTTNLEHKADHSALIMKQIWDFSQTVDIDDVKEILDRQIACNMAIANEGIHNSYGANIGHVILNMDSDCVKTKAKAYAAAGSDARMNGCELPVVINSGSGNQGITCCVPVVVYAKELNCTNEQLYRALVLSNLTAIYIKTGIGTLSAFCGAVSAGAAAGAGIAYLHDGTYEEIQHTIVNALAILSGTICDGAKASCAAKIASSIDAGIMGYYMYKNKQQFYAGDGIVAHSVDETIQNIGTLGSQGMLQTNDKIIEMMISCD
ncbi:L-serine ammonia-lyase, iron-sulfur-dependent, subunit alpha [uncultured Holdemanella sp.]|uniref:L-cysteine desulfidase family protein n=1 Tax=uncultured Holdemanella sp. TaxID=1763549 RepID=UPI0025DCB6AE|nr:L-serine ammonia-lyase, iron-sulfur-dependent, subunit alpha [uncultured Holdemanella sp.]